MLDKRLKELEREVIKRAKQLEEEENKSKKEIRPMTYGWVCPVCGAGNAPWTTTCPCVHRKYEVTC